MRDGRRRALRAQPRPNPELCFPKPPGSPPGQGFRISGLGLRDSGFIFQGFGFRISGLGSRVEDLGFRAELDGSEACRR